MYIASSGALDPRAYKHDVTEALIGASHSAPLSEELLRAWPRLVHALANAGALSPPHPHTLLPPAP